MTALVTGAAQGIGAAIARKLAQEGYQVAACDLRLAPDVAGVRPYVLDVSDINGHASVLEQISNDLGEITALVNAAGICTTQTIDQITPEGWSKTFSVNVQGAFFLSRACADRMQPGGAIVNIASVSGFLPKLEQIDYGASKAALVSLTRSMALVYGPKGIRVNSVAPGVIDTPLTQSIAQHRAELRGVEPEETLAPVLGATPLRRMGEADEVADVVAYLLSDKASFVTGQCLNACGGFLMR
jgi:NAD(P)-dependent dehydrogenase (short-subunit alcohol dehydrogenase family)